ncbi:hypothetical protein [Ruegeria meonggei]|uniref:hypothetical protein n=1 Tax=Ruegeria meonggei TaxID=1446476 RepID=UPI00366C4059
MTVANKNSRPVREIVYGVGEMGSVVYPASCGTWFRYHRSDRTQRKQGGCDLGDLAGLGTSLGVKAEADAKAVLARGADIAIVCVGSYLETMQRHFAVCLENEVNAVTIEEKTVYPWISAPDLAQELDVLARANGVTLAASGTQDVFWLNLITTLLGASHRIDRVEGHSV